MKKRARLGADRETLEKLERWQSYKKEDQLLSLEERELLRKSLQEERKRFKANSGKTTIQSAVESVRKDGKSVVPTRLRPVFNLETLQQNKQLFGSQEKIRQDLQPYIEDPEDIDFKDQTINRSKERSEYKNSPPQSYLEQQTLRHRLN